MLASMVAMHEISPILKLRNSKFRWRVNTDIQLYSDESLESFLLRLSQEQGYERFSHFAEDIWFDTMDQHEAIAGAFP